MSVSEQERWEKYLKTQPEMQGGLTRGYPEFNQVVFDLLLMGFKNGDFILDIGAGACELDHYLRTVSGWNGRYLPIDGSLQGIDLNSADLWSKWKDDKFTYRPDWIVMVETIEHLYDTDNILETLKRWPRKGVVITTPNSKVVDTLAVDPTHVVALTEETFTTAGFTVREYEFCGRGNDEHKDTLIAKYLVNELPERPDWI